VLGRSAGQLLETRRHRARVWSPASHSWAEVVTDVHPSSLPLAPRSDALIEIVGARLPEAELPRSRPLGKNLKSAGVPTPSTEVEVGRRGTDGCEADVHIQGTATAFAGGRLVRFRDPEARRFVAA
jgi:hypothetical protein